MEFLELSVQRNSSTSKVSKRSSPLISQCLDVDLSGFATEIQLLILKHLVLLKTKTPCLAAMFGECLSERECKEYHFAHDSDRRNLPVTLDAKLFSLNRDMFHEAQLIFVKNNTFLFDTLPLPLSDVGAGEAEYSEMRDPRASRLLDFVDKPEWKGQGSASFIHDKSYDQVDTYRNRIQHIIFDLRYDRELVRQYRPDWDWPLKVDWTTLPNLKTLVLDLRAYSMQEYIPTPLQPALRPFFLQQRREQFDAKISKGAEGMGCLRLKSLTLVGLCGGSQLWEDANRKEEVRKLFMKAMHPDGEIFLRDHTNPIDWSGTVTS